MSYEETRKLLRIIYLKFPSTWAKFTKEEAEELISLWFEDCRDVPYQGLIESLKIYQRRGEKFPPQSGELINIYLRVKYKVKSAEDSFVAIQKAVANSGLNSVEEFNKLSFLEKKIIASPSELRHYAYDETGAFIRFKKNYIARYNELLADPLTFSQIIQETKIPRIAVEKPTIEGKVEDKREERVVERVVNPKIRELIIELAQKTKPIRV